jgi:hypothetical protein
VKPTFRILLPLFFGFLLLAPVYAQSDRGSISGKVTDNTGAVLPATPVTLKNEATGVSQAATTNSAGDYVFELLNPGSYTLTVGAKGFKTTERTHIVVDVN